MILQATKTKSKKAPKATKHHRFHALGLVAVLSLIGLYSCTETDVVASYAERSFAALGEKLGPNAIVLDPATESWRLSSPGNDYFFIRTDLGQQGAQSSSGPQLALAFKVDAFLAAGLDPAKLSNNTELSYQIQEDRLYFNFTWPAGENSATASASATDGQGSASIQGTFAQLLASYRSRVGYHETLDHYGIALGGGNMVEWAKDLASNDKDLVFVLNPEPLLAAGLDPAKLQGWVLAPVEIKDDKGNTALVNKLLRPFEL